MNYVSVAKCQILFIMVHKGGYIFAKLTFRIQVDSTVRSVDSNIPCMDFDKFSRYFVSGDSDSESDWEEIAYAVEATEDKIEQTAEQTVKSHVADEERIHDGGSLTSMDSGIVESASKGIRDYVEKQTMFMSYT